MAIATANQYVTWNWLEVFVLGWLCFYIVLQIASDPASSNLSNCSLDSSGNPLLGDFELLHEVAIVLRRPQLVIGQVLLEGGHDPNRLQACCMKFPRPISSFELAGQDIGRILVRNCGRALDELD